MKRDAIRSDATAHEEAQLNGVSQVERATLGLRELLLRGAFPSGQRIAEIPLSKKLGVSRTPLRLAFERMEHEGLVRALPNSGFAASEFSIADIWDAIDARGILEGGAARLAAERLSNPAELIPLKKINCEMQEISNVEIDGFTRFHGLNEKFHAAILELGKSPALQRALEQIYKFPFFSPSGRVTLLRSLPAWKEIRPVGEEQHRALVEAIEQREGTRAESLAREHARVTRRHLEEALSDRNLLTSIPGGSLIKVHGLNRT